MAKIWGQEEIPELFLRLVSEAGSVMLKIVDADGDSLRGGIILGIDKKGILTVFYNVSSSLAERAGIKLDNQGKIKLEEEDCDDD